MQISVDNRSSISFALVVALLVAVAAGALMLTCAEDAHAAVPSPSHTGGTACDIHEGHSVSDAVFVTLPERSDVYDLSLSTDIVASQFASSNRVEAVGSLVMPPPVADPLFGRLLL